jgi:hypothetical protein
VLIIEILPTLRRTLYDNYHSKDDSLRSVKKSQGHKHQVPGTLNPIIIVGSVRRCTSTFQAILSSGCLFINLLETDFFLNVSTPCI